MQTLDGKILRVFALHRPVRSREWLAYIRTLSCSRHPGQRAEPHHIFGSVHGMKSSDIFTVPVCRSCHEYFEANPLANDGLILEWAKIAHRFIAEVLASEERSPLNG